MGKLTLGVFQRGWKIIEQLMVDFPASHMTDYWRVFIVSNQDFTDRGLVAFFCEIILEMFCSPFLPSGKLT